MSQQPFKPVIIVFDQETLAIKGVFQDYVSLEWKTDLNGGDISCQFVLKERPQNFIDIGDRVSVYLNPGEEPFAHFIVQEVPRNNAPHYRFDNIVEVIDTGYYLSDVALQAVWDGVRNPGASPRNPTVATDRQCPQAEAIYPDCIGYDYGQIPTGTYTFTIGGDFTAVDLTGQIVGLWYIPYDTEWLTTNLKLRLISSAGNYYELDIPDYNTELWTVLEIDYQDPSITTVGSPDITAITRFEFEFDNSNNQTSANQAWAGYLHYYPRSKPIVEQNIKYANNEFLYKCSGLSWLAKYSYDNAIYTGQDPDEVFDDVVDALSFVDDFESDAVTFLNGNWESNYTPVDAFLNSLLKMSGNFRWYFEHTRSGHTYDVHITAYLKELSALVNPDYVYTQGVNFSDSPGSVDGKGIVNDTALFSGVIVSNTNFRTAEFCAPSVQMFGTRSRGNRISEMRTTNNRHTARMAWINSRRAGFPVFNYPNLELFNITRPPEVGNVARLIYNNVYDDMTIKTCVWQFRGNAWTVRVAFGESPYKINPTSNDLSALSSRLDEVEGMIEANVP